MPEGVGAYAGWVCLVYSSLPMVTPGPGPTSEMHVLIVPPTVGPVAPRLSLGEIPMKISGKARQRLFGDEKKQLKSGDE